MNIETIIKILRGLISKLFFKKSAGLIFIGAHAKISHKNHIILGKNVKFERNCEVQGLARKGLKFGNNVTIGADTMIRPSSYYGIDLGEGLEIGDNSSIGPLSYIGCSGFIKIGNNVMFGPKVSLFAENHNFSNKDIDSVE